MLGVFNSKKRLQVSKVEPYANYRYLNRSKRHLKLSLKAPKISSRDLIRPSIEENRC